MGQRGLRVGCQGVVWKGGGVGFAGVSSLVHDGSGEGRLR